MLAYATNSGAALDPSGWPLYAALVVLVWLLLDSIVEGGPHDR